MNARNELEHIPDAELHYSIGCLAELLECNPMATEAAGMRRALANYRAERERRASTPAKGEVET